MIRHLLEESKLILVFLILFSCKEQKRENSKEYSFQNVIISDQLKKEIFSYKEDLRRIQSTESNNISLSFINRNDSVFIEMGDYKPNLEMTNMIGVEVMKKDTVYLFGNKNFIGMNHFYENKYSEKIKIISNAKLTFDHYDPHYRCLYFDGKFIKVCSYNNKCK